MPATTPDNLRYPLRADKPAGADQIEALATDVQAALTALPLVQWGMAVRTTAEDGTAAVDMPAGFVGLPTVVAVLGDPYAGVAAYIQMVVQKLTPTSFTVMCRTAAGQPAAGAAVRINWIAVGAKA